MQTRGIPSRNRRAVDDPQPDNTIRTGNDEVAIDVGHRSKMMLKRRRDILPIIDVATVASTNETVATTETSSQVVVKNDTQRNRRQVPGCIVNYNAQRQLLIGCSQPEVIEVRPQCNDEGDEGKILHIIPNNWDILMSVCIYVYGVYVHYIIPLNAKYY